MIWFLMGAASLAMGYSLYLLLLVFLVFLVGSIGLRGARRRSGRRGVGFGTDSTLDVSNDYFETVQIEQEEEEEVFDLAGIAEAEGWDQTELMNFVFEFGTKKGMHSPGQEVQQAVCPEPTKEAKVRFLFRESGRLGVQVVDGGLTLEEWFAGREGENLGVGVDGYFTTLGGKILNLGRRLVGWGWVGFKRSFFMAG